MQSRRQFIVETLVTLAGVCASVAPSRATQLSAFQGGEVFQRILRKSIAGNWRDLPIGELMGKIATELEGTPYVANTLELSSDKEFCSVNLCALDCVTFFETTLAYARVLKKHKNNITSSDLLSEVSFVRYRGGKLGDYTSRLHYTTDWLADNERKHVVKILSDLAGSQPFPQKVSIMSSHPETSRQLTAHPELVAKIRQQEGAINARSLIYVPTEKIASIESSLHTGDIVAICTNVPGLDVTHTGMIFCTADGARHFMDATSRKDKLKVMIEPEPLTQALSRSKHTIGAMFARPLEPV